MTLNQFKSNLNFPEWLYERFLKLIIYPSIWVAAAIASLGIYTQELLNIGHDWRAIILIFVTALIPYNLDRIFDSYVQKIPDDKAQLFFRKPYVWALLLSAIAATAILLYEAPIKVRYASLVGIVPLLYGTPLFPVNCQSKWRWYRLKDIPGSKAWIVGSVLTYAVIALPIAYAEAEFDIAAIFTTIFMFVFIVTNSHIFDVRDLDSDREKGVVTLPVIIGIKMTKVVLTAMNLLMLLTIIAAWLNDILIFRPEIILAVLVNLIYVWSVDFDTPRWVYSIWIEGCLFLPIIGYGVLLLF